MRFLATLLALLLLGACGTRSGLSLPPRPVPAGAAPATPAAPPADDSKAGGGAGR